jgi:hypothetical protein
MGMMATGGGCKKGKMATGGGRKEEEGVLI